MFDSVRVASRTKVDALVIARFKDAALDKQTLAHDKDGSIKAALKRAEGNGDLGAIAEAFPAGRGAPARVIIVGLGDKKGVDTAAVRTAAGAVARRLAKVKAASAKVDLAGPIKSAKLDAGAAGQAFGEGVGLVAWTCDTFRGSATPDPDRTKLAIAATGAFATGVKRGLALAESTNITRTLSQTPPNIATPMFMAAEARKIARQTGMTCTVIKGKQLEAERMEGHINVGKASENEPCLIRIEYKPKTRSKAAKPAVLIGKTITYDTGGLSIKPTSGMKGMKRDKDGGCAVLGAMHAIATVIKPSRPVVGFLVAAENSISDEAYRPDDVLTFRNGVTVEVTNTDAEGRLVLADGLCWACAQGRPGLHHRHRHADRRRRCRARQHLRRALVRRRQAPRQGAGRRRRHRRTCLATAPPRRVPRPDALPRRRHRQLRPGPRGTPHPGRRVPLPLRRGRRPVGTRRHRRCSLHRQAEGPVRPRADRVRRPPHGRHRRSPLTNANPDPPRVRLRLPRACKGCRRAVTERRRATRPAGPSPPETPVTRAALQPVVGLARVPTAAELLSPIRLAANLWRHRDIVLQFAAREVQQLSKGTVLGRLWRVITPIIRITIYALVFGMMLKLRFQGDSHYAFFLFTGIIVFGLMNDAAGKCANLVVNRSRFVKKLVFPVEILPVSVLLSSLVIAATELLVLIALYLAFYQSISPWFWLFPIVMVPAFMLALGVAWFLSALCVFLEDVAEASRILVNTVLFFMTPIIYPITAIENIPERFAAARWIIEYNPFTILVEAGRDVLLRGQLPNWQALGVVTLVSIIVMQLGYAFFMKSKRGFADVL